NMDANRPGACRAGPRIKAGCGSSEIAASPQRQLSGPGGARIVAPRQGRGTGSGRPVAVAQGAEEEGQVFQPFAHDMGDAALALDPAADAQKSRLQYRLAIFPDDVRPADQVGDPGLVLDRDEDDAARRPGLLADQH